MKFNSIFLDCRYGYILIQKMIFDKSPGNSERFYSIAARLLFYVILPFIKKKARLINLAE